MDIKDRVAMIRQHADLSQRAFADRIGVSVGVISNIELGRAPVTPVVCIAICSKFGIREEWLFHGEGDMLEPSDALEALIRQRNMNDLQERFVRAAAALTPDMAQVLSQVLDLVRDGVHVEDALPTIRASDLPPYIPQESQNEKKSG